MKKITWLVCLFFFPLYNFSQQNSITINGEAQGSTYHIVYFDEQNRDFKPEIEQILKDFDLSLSTYIPISIISRINSNDPNVRVDKYFIACFKKAKEVWKNTNGAFDPTVYPLVNAWGFGPGKKLKIEQKKIDSILEFVGFKKIKLKGNKIVKSDPRVSLDFNAFAQGYSVDVVSEFLNSIGIKAYIVEIGGEVYAKGKKPNGENWTIGIEQPIENKESVNPVKAIVKLENMGVATSGDYRSFMVENGIKYAHTMSPKTGYPVKNNLLSVSLFSTETITSDAMATGIMVMGLEKAIVFLKKHKELQAYMIYLDENGTYQVYETPGIKAIVSEVKE
jgi:thiamine biosynthesis lipoprotein